MSKDLGLNIFIYIGRQGKPHLHSPNCLLGMSQAAIQAIRYVKVLDLRQSFPSSYPDPVQRQRLQQSIEYKTCMAAFFPSHVHRLNTYKSKFACICYMHTYLYHSIQIMLVKGIACTCTCRADYNDTCIQCACTVPNEGFLSNTMYNAVWLLPQYST